MKTVLAGGTSSAARAAISQLSSSPSSITLRDRPAQGRSSVTGPESGCFSDDLGTITRSDEEQRG